MKEIRKIIKKMVNESLKQKDIPLLPFYSDVKKEGGKIYSVGGAVRDQFLGKESKDLDILITGLPLDKLETILSKHGKVDSVGKSFGILKFKAPGESEEIDIAIPRSEKKTGEGHKGFEVTSDHNLSIEDDLFRRDFKLNSIAKDDEGNIIDPYGGMEDIKNKVISLTNPLAFSDDPLRMLRAIQFAARFNFNIEPRTFQAIKDNASKIKEIPGERIFIELEKIVNKGNKESGLKLLVASGLFKEIFGKDYSGNYVDSTKATDMPEYMFSILKDDFQNPQDVYKNVLKGDIDGINKITALNMAKEVPKEDFEKRLLLFKMNSKSPSSLESNLIPDELKPFAQEMIKGSFPLAIKDLNINGDDLMALGFKGKQIGEKLKDILISIYKGDLKNNKEDIIKFVS